MSNRPTLLFILALSACHTDPFAYRSQLGPAASGTDVLLTYNSALDYWPALTEDGQGILYAFLDATQHDVTAFNHRCVGLMPIAGGTRFWQWCDNGAVQGDSLNSIPAFAIGNDGRLMYLEATTPKNSVFITPTVALWLADTAAPQRRRSLAKLPIIVGDSTVSWLADIQWTGPTSFAAVAQRMVLAGHCNACIQLDSVFYGEMIVAGTIGASGATLIPIAGTAGATSYAFAENGASILFTRRDSTSLMKVPAVGGTAMPVPVTPRTGVQLLGVSCRTTTCVVAVDPVTLWNGPADIYAAINPGPSELRSVSLATGQVTTILSRSGSILSSPLITSSGDVVAQVGSIFGHLQTFLPLSDLHLYPGLVP